MLESTVTLPSAFMCTTAPEIDGVSTAFTPQAMPLARTGPLPGTSLRGGFGGSHSMASATFSSACFTPMLSIGAPVAKRSPSPRRLRSRSSTGSMPSASATTSIWLS